MYDVFEKQVNKGVFNGQQSHGTVGRSTELVIRGGLGLRLCWYSLRVYGYRSFCPLGGRDGRAFGKPLQRWGQGITAAILGTGLSKDPFP